ncbi:MAG: tyrosine-protein kinase family protein [Firmicutes bacterium]|nr:tyrosine-protein kinase family protein [Bacillota bacterium]
MENKRIRIFTGNFGSGKSEIAINFALQKAEAGFAVSLVDLDIVNPYFRSRQLRHLLAERGVTTVVPREEWLEADLPIITPAICKVFQDESQYVIFDVGGDEIGATVLGTFKPQFVQQGFELLMVVNPYRPLTGNVADIAAMRQEIERAARLAITGLVSNPHLGTATEARTIWEGHRIVEEAARATGLPIEFLTVARELLSKCAAYSFACPVLPIDLYLQPDWLRDDEGV